MLRKLYCTLLVSSFLLGSVQGQGSFDLISLDTKKFFWNFQIVPGSATNITNSTGYDNQPKFINNTQVVFSSQAGDSKHDIMMYNFETGNYTNLTRTVDKSEFSPSLTDCGLYVSAVTVAEDSSQMLWLYPVNQGEPELLYDDITPVAYYDWYDNVAAMVVLGEPNKLIYPKSKEEILTLAENVGRSINLRPKTSQITYLNAASNIVVDGRKAYELKSYDIKTGEELSLGPALGESEDFLWIDKNNLLMARGKNLYVRNVKKSISWEHIATVSMPGYTGISRMALNPKASKLVLVMEKE
ncbi:MAG TPA: hypothetical protein VKZ51_01720 [Cyclobacteriaceae bacterium]|nr:hypothetical protein [Cyclobacteriaceae bacterium]